jgi:hypothetical protein
VCGGNNYGVDDDVGDNDDDGDDDDDDDNDDGDGYVADLVCCTRGLIGSSTMAHQPTRYRL